MRTVHDILTSLSELRETLRQDYGVCQIGLFGSFVHGSQGPKSDIDILVDFDRPLGLFEFVGLKQYLSEVLGLPVDLVMKKALRPTIGQRILRDVIYV